MNISTEKSSKFCSTLTLVSRNLLSCGCRLIKLATFKEEVSEIIYCVLNPKSPFLFWKLREISVRAKYNMVTKNVDIMKTDSDRKQTKNNQSITAA